MKESVGSLRAFFILVGLFGLFGYGLVFLGSFVVIAVKPLLGIFLAVFFGLATLLSLGYLYCGMFLPTLLRTNASTVLLVIMANIGFQIVSLIYTLVTVGFSIASMGGAAFGFLISLYLLNSIRRLSSMPV